jgi:glucuronate isomerase
MIPTFRPDAAHRLLDDPPAWNAWVDRLPAVPGSVDSLDSLLGALAASSARFADLGCRASDHGLRSLPDAPRDPALADTAVHQVSHGEPCSDAGRDAVLLEVAALAARLAFADDSVLQLHLGGLRDASPRLLALVGRDGGGDVMNDERQAPGLARFLGGLERDGTLPRTILYNLNPADNALFATMAGAFSRPGVPMVVQWGPPWWFNDHEAGMRLQLDDLSQIDQLAGFMGMLTDSRSILSMTRHELFRRVLCDVIGRDVDQGRLPPDFDWISTVVRDVCVDNAVRFFGLPPLRSG